MRTQNRTLIAAAVLAAATTTLSGCALTPKPVSTAGRPDITAAVPSSSASESPSASPSSSPSASETPSATPTSEATSAPSAKPKATPSAAASSKSSGSTRSGSGSSSTGSSGNGGVIRVPQPVRPTDKPWVAMKDQPTRIAFSFPRVVKPKTTVSPNGRGHVRVYQTGLVDGTNTAVSVVDGLDDVAAPNDLKPVARAQGDAMAKVIGGGSKAVLGDAHAIGNNVRPGLDARVIVSGGKTSVLYRVRVLQDGKGTMVVAISLIATRGSLSDAIQRRVQSVYNQLAGSLRVP